jgi:serine protease Do
VVLRANGQAIEQAGDFSFVVGLAQPLDRLELAVWRRGKEAVLHITMDDSAEAATKKVVNSPAAPVNRLGLALRLQKPEELRDPGTAAGLLIEKVSGAAERAGVQVGDVLLSINQEPVSSVDHANVLANRAGRSVALLLVRDGDRIFVPLRLAAIPTI